MTAMRTHAGKLIGYIGKEPHVTVILLLPAVVFACTLNRYYGYYYDNKFFNLLALELWESPRLYLYLGSHYHVPSTLYSYLAYPFFLVLGPGDLALELLSSIFHILTVLVCYMIGARFHGKVFGSVFAVLVALSPIHLIQIYTIPDLSFAVFLSVSALYLYMRGLEERSSPRVAISAAVYALACFQAIYFLLLMPFYAAYSLIYLFRKGGMAKNRRLLKRLMAGAAAGSVFLILLPAYGYLYLLAQAVLGFQPQKWMVYAVAASGSALLVALRKKLPDIIFSMQFIYISVALLLYFDLMVQIDYWFFGHSFGYFLDAIPAGGYDGRPAAHFAGRELTIYGKPVHMSVLTSMLEFVGNGTESFARTGASSFESLRHLYSAYYLKSYPASIVWLSFAGAFFFIISSVAKILRGDARAVLYIYPLVLLATVLIPIADLGPDYYNIRRIYIPPVPYLFAAFGITVIARAALYPAMALCHRHREYELVAASAAILAAFVTLAQIGYSIDNIYQRYDSDRKTKMYFRLFYGHAYGRSYKEVGDFLLKDAPPRQGGAYRAALVFTIPEDTLIGRSLPLFNTVNWYARNQVKVIYDFKKKSSGLYGTKELLAAYLEKLFKENPALDAVYFADFVDYGENFSYFSKAHPAIKPYAVVDDGGHNNYDCKLYKFEKWYWKDALLKTP